MHIGLEQCGAEQAGLISRIALQSYREHYLYLWAHERYAEWYMNRSFSAPSLITQLQDPGTAFYLVRAGSDHCGMLKINWEHRLPDKPGSMELERIYLLRAWSGKGIGRTVLQQLVQMAKEAGKKMIWLKSMDSSPSVQFYEQVGFRKTVKERLDFEGFNDAYRHMWVMELPIDT